MITEHLGEIEATRISKLLAVIMVAQFSFEEGLSRIEQLYAQDMDQMIDSCLDKLAPENYTIELKDIKHGLLVNLATHTDEAKLKVIQDLYQTRVSLGQKGAHVSKE